MQLFYPVNTTPTAMNVSINWQWSNVPRAMPILLM
jgi:hypothetical protein